VWNKRFNEASNKGFLDGFIEVEKLRNYQKMAEYCLFYTFQDKTGLKVVDNNLELYKPIRDYFRDERKKTNLSYKDLNELMGVASNGGGMASNILTSYKKGWTFPTKEKYELLQTTGICQKPYEELRQEYEELRQEYEELRQECESLRYTFNLNEVQENISCVWTNKEINSGKKHSCQKPTDILEKIIKTSSNEYDIILDCFMGSGSTGVACANTNRKFIGIELDENYFNIAKQRIEDAYNKEI
jgi:site-specific DNA-methyltransferase (adenine-specific)